MSVGAGGSSSGPLPEFDRPPLAEVALAIVFHPLNDFGVLDLYGLRSRWLADYPEVQEQPALPPPPPVNAPMQVPFSIEMNAGLPPLRIWMLRADAGRVVQVQNDRVIVNWRIEGASGEGRNYPRYSELRRELVARFEDFVAFGRENGKIAAPQPIAVEVSYTNQIVEPEWTLPDLIRTTGAVVSHLGSPLQSSIAYQFDCSVLDGRPSQLSVNSGSLVNATPRSWGLQTAYQANCGGTDDAWAALDQGHAHAVRVFADLTTDSAHTAWGRRV